MIGTETTENARRATQAVAFTVNEGATLPKDVAAAQKTVDRALERLAGIEATSSRLSQALESALAAGDPLADTGVQDALRARQLVSTTEWASLKAQAHTPLERAVHGNLDALAEAWRRPFNKHADALTQARKALGDVDLHDAQAVLALGGDAAAQRIAALDALKAIERFTKQWTITNRGARYPVLITVPDLPLARYQQLPAKVDPWKLAGAGMKLTLATFSEYRNSQARLESEQARVNSEAANARRIRNGGMVLDATPLQ